MGAWHGREGKGAKRILRAVKRIQAEDRNEVTPWEKTAAYRRLQERLGKYGSRSER